MIIFPIACFFFSFRSPFTKVTDWHCIRLDPTAAGFRQLRDQNHRVGISQDIPRLYTSHFQHPPGSTEVCAILKQKRQWKYSSQMMILTSFLNISRILHLQHWGKKTQKQTQLILSPVWSALS